MKISDHAKLRFAERIMNKDDNDAKRYVAANADMIKERIEKMMEYATLVYRGESFSYSNSKDVSVYINGSWILIYDNPKNTVVTLYELDLGLGKELNDMYTSKLLEKIKELRTEYEEKTKQRNESLEVYKEKIKENAEVIIKYRTLARELETENENLKSIIENDKAQEVVDSQNLRDLVATLISKKVF